MSSDISFTEYTRLQMSLQFNPLTGQLDLISRQPGPAGADGPQGPAGPAGPPGPTAVSTDANNAATLGTDSLIYVPATAIAVPEAPLTGGPYGRQSGAWVEVVGPAGAAFWDDLVFPATFMNPTGAAAPPLLDNDNGWALYDASTQNTAGIVVQFPHRWKEGSTFYPHCHWCKTTNAAGAVVWQMEYKWSPIGQLMDKSWTVLTVSTPFTATVDDNSARRHLISAFPPVSGAGKKISDLLIVRFSRLAPDAEDTYAGPAGLFQFDLHIQVDSFGSRMEYVK